MNNKICPHCDPYNNHPLHLLEKVLFLIQPVLLPSEWLLSKFPNLYSALSKFIFYNFFRFLLITGILKEVNVSDEDRQIYNRTLVIVHEARRRNILVKSIKLFGKKSTNFFSIIINGRKRIFEGLPCLDIGHVSHIDIDDKFKLKQILKRNKLPYLQGEIFHNYKSTLQYVKEIGFPVVVKPRSGSLSQHITCNIQTEDLLKEAIRIVKKISPEFIVEKFIEGNVYRIILVDSKFIACCLREPPNIVGDGIHTVEELIGIKNLNPLRGEMHQKNFSLHKIPITERTISLLREQNLTLYSIIPLGKKVYLHTKVILACGADTHDKTEEAHPENKLLFQKVANTCGAPVVGLDFICKDISWPHFKQECAIIEANSLPYIDMHHYPLTGNSQNVASHILDYCLPPREVEQVKRKLTGELEK